MKKCLLALSLLACGPVPKKPDPATPPPAQSPPPTTPAPQAPCDARCFGWTDGKDISVPIAAGAGSSIWFGVYPAPARAVSTNPSVAQFYGLESDQITVYAGKPGTTDLVLFDASGAEVGRAPITVAATDELSSRLPSLDVVMLDGIGATFHVSTVTRGEPTVGVGAVHFAATGVAALSFELFRFCFDDSTDFYGWGVGGGSVIASASDARSELKIRFVARDWIDGLSATPPSAGVRWPDGTMHQVVEITAKVGADAVYGVTCNWKLSPGVQLYQEGANGLEGPPTDHVEFSLTQSGTATCIAGSAKLVIPLTD